MAGMIVTVIAKDTADLRIQFVEDCERRAKDCRGYVSNAKLQRDKRRHEARAAAFEEMASFWRGVTLLAPDEFLAGIQAKVNLKHPCPHCKWGFWSPEVLAQHIKEKHGGQS